MIKKPFDLKGLFNLQILLNDRRLFTFVICLTIATALWFLNALSKSYTTTLSYPVKYINPPSNQFLANTPASEFEITVEGYGFSLLRHKMAFSFSPVLLNLTTIKQNFGDKAKQVTVPTGDLVKQISGQISKEVKILDIRPQVITLVMDSLKTKKVTVKPVVELDLMPQYFLSDSIVLNPPAVEISGPAAIIDTIEFLRTEPQAFNEVKTSIQQVVKIICPEHTTLSDDKTTMYIHVEKFTEKEVRLHLQAKNIPEGAQVKLFPSEVKITFLVNLSEYNNINEDNFTAYVDLNSGNNKETLKVLLDHAPPDIKMIRVNPENVEYLIETN